MRYYLQTNHTVFALSHLMQHIFNLAPLNLALGRKQIVCVSVVYHGKVVISLVAHYSVTNHAGFTHCRYRNLNCASISLVQLTMQSIVAKVDNVPCIMGCKFKVGVALLCIMY